MRSCMVHRGLGIVLPGRSVDVRFTDHCAEDRVVEQVVVVGGRMSAWGGNCEFLRSLPPRRVALDEICAAERTRQRARIKRLHARWRFAPQLSRGVLVWSPAGEKHQRQPPDQNVECCGKEVVSPWVQQRPAMDT